MAEKDLISNEKVEYTGVFSFSGLYSFVHSWLNDQESYAVGEDKYSEKVSGNSRDISVEWSASKKMGDYFKAEMKVEFKVSDLTDVEVEMDGKKKRMNKGKVSVGIKGILVKDYSSNWEDKPLNKFLREVYNKYIIPQRVENMEGKLAGDVSGLKEEIKSYLETAAKK